MIHVESSFKFSSLGGEKNYTVTYTPKEYSGDYSVEVFLNGESFHKFSSIPRGATRVENPTKTQAKNIITAAIAEKKKAK